MTLYRVVWEIDIEADTPLAAAEEALRIQRDRDSIATVFRVYGPDQKNVLVDLLPMDDS